MRDLERDLAAMLEERALRIGPPANAVPVLRRARRRRAATAATAGLLSLALVSGAVATIGRTTAADRVPPVTTRDEDLASLTSSPGEYPYVATGSFRGMQWELRAAPVRPDRGDVRLTFAVSGDDGASHSTSGPLGPRYPTLVVNRLDERHALDPDVDVLWGVVRPGIARVDVEVDDGQGTMIPAHLFAGHDSRTGIRADYWVAFVPRDAEAYVLARDRFGTTRARHELGTPTPPRDQIATGRAEDTNWYLSLTRGGTGAVPGSRRNEICLSITDTRSGYALHCIERDELRTPVYISYLDTEDVRVVVGILGRGVKTARLKVGSRTAVPPVLRVADDGEIRVKLVALGLPPGSTGYLEGLDRRGRVVFSSSF